jgi:hypothetical protein
VATEIKTFEAALREQLETRKDEVSGYKRRRLLRLLNSDGAFRARRLARMEAHARVELEAEGVKFGAGAIDWSSIDWNKFFQQLFELLMKLLPLFLAVV